jgi:hypothetical protein
MPQPSWQNGRPGFGLGGLDIPGGKFPVLYERCHVFAKGFGFDDPLMAARGFEDILKLVLFAIRDLAAHNIPKRTRETSKIYHYLLEANKACTALLKEVADWTVDYAVDECSIQKETIEACDHACNKLLYHFNVADDKWENKNMTCLVYAIGMLAKNAIETAKDFQDFSHPEGPQAIQHESSIEIMAKGFRNAFRLPQNAEEWDYCLRHTFVLIITFAMGNLFCVGVFAPFDATMAGTLAILLTTDDAGTSFYAHVQRLLGLILGKCCTIIFMQVVGAFGNESRVTIIHLIIVFIFMSTFSYIKYSSAYWGPTSKLVAAWGCYGLMGTDVYKLWSTSVFITIQMQAAQLVFGIGVRVLTDMACARWRKTFARDIATRDMRRVGLEYDTGHLGLLTECFDCFFDGHVLKEDGMDGGISVEALSTDLKRTMTRMHHLVDELEERTLACPGHRRAFLAEMYSGVLKSINGIVQVIDVLLITCKSDLHGHRQTTSHSDIAKGLAPVYKNSIKRILQNTFQTLQQVLEHPYQTPLVADAPEEEDVDDDDGENNPQFQTDFRYIIMNQMLQLVAELNLEIQHQIFISGAFTTKAAADRDARNKAEMEEEIEEDEVREDNPAKSRLPVIDQGIRPSAAESRRDHKYDAEENGRKTNDEPETVQPSWGAAASRFPAPVLSPQASSYSPRERTESPSQIPAHSRMESPSRLPVFRPSSETPRSFEETSRNGRTPSPHAMASATASSRSAIGGRAEAMLAKLRAVEEALDKVHTRVHKSSSRPTTPRRD